MPFDLHPSVLPFLTAVPLRGGQYGSGHQWILGDYLPSFHLYECVRTRAHAYTCVHMPVCWRLAAHLGSLPPSLPSLIHFILWAVVSQSNPETHFPVWVLLASLLQGFPASAIWAWNCRQAALPALWGSKCQCSSLLDKHSHPKPPQSPWVHFVWWSRNKIARERPD